jgi:hypothetical protein
MTRPDAAVVNAFGGLVPHAAFEKAHRFVLHFERQLVWRSQDGHGCHD